MLQFFLRFNEVLAFFLELALFYAVGSYGYTFAKSSIMKWLFCIVFVGIAITMWGFLAAPKSEYRLNSTSRYIFELFMFLVGAFLVYKLNHSFLALAFAILAITSVGIAFYFKQ